MIDYEIYDNVDQKHHNSHNVDIQLKFSLPQNTMNRIKQTKSCQKRKKIESFRKSCLLLYKDQCNTRRAFTPKRVICTCEIRSPSIFNPLPQDTPIETNEIRFKGGFMGGPRGPQPPLLSGNFFSQIFQHYKFNMESRHLRNLSVWNTPDCISENFNLKNFAGGACTQNSPEKCAIHNPDAYWHCILHL